MPLFVHIAPEPKLKVILRNGIAATAWRPDPADHPDIDRVVWMFPVLASDTMTLSWARELKRWGRTTLAAIAVRLRGDEMVFARHYREQPVAMTASQAVGIIRAADDARGYEVMVPRRVRADEITGSRVLRQTFGWRYAPQLKGKPLPSCDCPMCLPRGEVKAAVQRAQIFERIRSEGRELESRLALPVGRRKRKARAGRHAL